jgi:hypothetical protein
LSRLGALWIGVVREDEVADEVLGRFLETAD